MVLVGEKTLVGFDDVECVCVCVFVNGLFEVLP